MTGDALTMIGRDERRNLLVEAAGLVDSLDQPLGVTHGATHAGDLLRDLAGDDVGFARDPLVFRLDEASYSSRGLPVPLAYVEATRQHRLYWLYAPVSLFPARHWGFNALDVRLAFNPDAADGTRCPVTFNVLPDAEVENVIDAGGSVEVRLDPSLRFKAKTPDVDLTAVGVPVQASAGIEASAVANAHAALGPFRYRVTRAVVSHTPVGMEYVRWRIDRAASLDGAGPSLIVLLAVPEHVHTVIVDAQMAAWRYFKFATAPLQEKIRQLPKRLRDFLLRDGAPVQRRTVWDVSGAL